MDHNRELIGLGAANIGSGSMSGMTVNGSAGARSQVSGLVVAVLTVVTLLGLIIGIVVSLLLLLYRSSRPHVAELGRVVGTTHQFGDVERHPEHAVALDVAVMRVEAGLFFANADAVRRAVRRPTTKMGDVDHCCTPGRAAGPAPIGDPAVASAPNPGAPALLDIPGGSFHMGSVGTGAYPADGEGPIHVVELSPHRIAPHAVTNEEFAAFVDATGHVSEAERFGWSFVFAGLLPDDFPPTRAVVQTPWWRQVEGADWRHPEGPHSDVAGRARHPVVHVTWHDAVAFCAWQGTRLPTEAEWEHAARGGRRGLTFPWGDELEPGGEHAMNVFQGTFPAGDTAADGYAGTAPVDAYEANGFGAYNMTGNVWEWCHDWFSPTYYRHSDRRDPHGPAAGTQRVMRGGSYLCHESYCRRYRVAARSSNTPDSSAGNIGFRVAAGP